MARIAFILLCHKDPQGIIAQARRLTQAGDMVAIHFDARANPADYQTIRSALADNPSVAFAARRIRCGWGEWSLVEATLSALRTALDAFPRASHLYMLSGDCMPVKSARYAHDLLDRADRDHIETVDFFASDWIKTGLKAERLIYRHWVNERTHKRLFYASLALQRRLGLSRTPPAGIEMRIGSQWWCLRRQTVETVLAFCDAQPEVMRFFATTWIPDETFFQTLVPHLIPRDEISARTLTFLMFTDYGMPVTFHNDHFDLLVSQGHLFARKISADALELRQRLGALWQADTAEFPVSDEAPGLYRFLTQRGRVGRRFGERFWEAEGSLGAGRTLMMIVCKKWHVAKRLTERIRALTPIPAVDYLFNETEANLPDLGGVEKTVGKRHRHRRALLRVLYNRFDADRLVICLDPSALELIQDFAADRAQTRVLLVETDLDDAYVRGHIGRVGLAGGATSPATIARLVRTVRSDLAEEEERLCALDLPSFHRLSARAAPGANAAALAAFLGLDPDTAAALADTPHLFSD